MIYGLTLKGAVKEERFKNEEKGMKEDFQKTFDDYLQHLEDTQQEPTPDQEIILKLHEQVILLTEQLAETKRQLCGLRDSMHIL